MTPDRRLALHRLALLGAAFLPAACSTAGPLAPPPAPPRLARRGDRVAVSIVEFRSSVGEVSARGATDMFATALVASGRFQLVERARLNEGVWREKQINAAGQSGGKGGRVKLRAAEFLFEASVTELNAGETQTQGGIQVGGLQLGGSSSTDTLGIDVRIVDAASGEVRDALSLRRELASTSTQVGGVGVLVQTVRAARGRSTSPLVPDLSYQTSRKASVDLALRGLIGDAVAQLAARF